MKILSIIIPVYNEEKTVKKLLIKVFTQKLVGWKKEIIVVDDGSKDNSKLKIKNLKLKLKIKNLKLLEQKHLGRGKAIQTGINISSGDVIIFQDADLEYNPKDYPKLLKPYEDKNCQVVYGTRTVNPKYKGYWYYVLGAGFLTSLTNLLYNSHLTDLYTGYKLFRTQFIKSLKLVSNGFEFEAEITAKTLKKGVQIIEVPIHYYPRTFTQGKKITPLDGVGGFISIIKNRF